MSVCGVTQRQKFEGGEVVSGVKSILGKKSASSTELFASLEAIRLISIIDSKTDKSVPETPGAKSQKPEEKKQEQPQKNQQQKGNSGQSEKPQWKDLPERYKPDNKNMSGGSGGGENPVIFRSTVEAPKRLLRQTVYDVVTAKEFVSNPLLRPSLISDRHQVSDKSPITYIDTLGANQIVIPIQSDHEPGPGKYNGYEILEKSPGEFVAHITQKNLKTIGMWLRPTREQKFTSVHNEGNYLHATGIDIKDWPRDIQLLVKKLKNSSQDRISLAREMEKYFQKDGGYLYYSEGDKLSKADLESIDEKVRKYATRYAEPVALAYGKAFNCDGAAWVAAILLRDYLGVPNSLTKRAKLTNYSYIIFN
jgi:hypothetical protein